MKHTDLKKVAAATIVGAALLLMFSPGQSFAQGFGGLSQFLGGGGNGGGQRHSQSSGNSNAVTVQRDAEPYVGNFEGKQKEPGADLDLSAHFVCYPGHDAALPQSNTYVCYTAGGAGTGGPGARASGAGAAD
ncbi:MAG TPA: hypothetical protein VMB26_03645 [Candidatus Binataceae bacterium]|nr:hypothetical protein [Candidatus Binataceae bacterium]